ncbi:MAG: Hsp20/alpha crystallin family protein [Methylococcaceae bacterium]|nr:Hsp20/alpha crystallin family protein [Methylococcaceae bacterium]
MQKSILTGIAVILFIALAIQTYMFFQLKNQVDQMTTQKTSHPFQLPGMAFDDEFMKNDNWNPYQEMQRMQNEMEQMFGDSFSRFHLNSNNALTKSPRFDLKEESDRYIATLDIPGGEPSSLDVKIEEQQLFISIKTERSNQQDDDEDKNKFRRQERFSGTYQRSITLPGPVRPSAMTSNYENGVLTVMLPKE